MSALSEQRCLNHALREAVALCPICRRFFCRECITEHDDRVICAGCLARQWTARTTGKRGGIAVQAGQCFLGLLTAWFFFYLIGQGLLALPSTFHEGEFWKAKFWEEP